MRILVTGATGLIGSALRASLERDRHAVISIGRPGSGKKPAIVWNPEAGLLDGPALEGADAAVHLAGESIAGGRWSDAQKKRILESRVKGTALLARTLAGLSKPPAVLVCASAVGYYGDRGDQVLDESAAPGLDFLATVCKAWEGAAAPAGERGIRVAHVRFGVVLSREGGALAKLLTPFRFGVGGVIGSGRQYMSWIALEDVIGAIRHAIDTPDLAGAVNVTAPRPVTNREFTKTLGRVLHRPTILPLPAFAARMLLGEMADALLLASQRAVPARLSSSGYRFRLPDLEPALRNVLGKPAE